MTAAMDRLAAPAPAPRVWDSLPLLLLRPNLPGDAGRPLFLDGDHLSGHGNDVVYPRLKAMILQARGPRR